MVDKFTDYSLHSSLSFPLTFLFRYVYSEIVVIIYLIVSLQYDSGLIYISLSVCMLLKNHECVSAEDVYCHS